MDFEHVKAWHTFYLKNMKQYRDMHLTCEGFGTD